MLKKAPSSEILTQRAEVDLNTKSLAKQKTIKSLIVKTQWFQITIKENPPGHVGNSFDKFWVP